MQGLLSKATVALQQERGTLDFSALARGASRARGSIDVASMADEIRRMKAEAAADGKVDATDPVQSSDPADVPVVRAETNIQEWRLRLKMVFDSAQAVAPSRQKPMIVGIAEQVLDCVEELYTREVKAHRTELERLRGRLKWDKEQNKKLQDSMRSASSIESQHLATIVKEQLEIQHAAALEHVQSELRETNIVCERKIEKHKSVENTLLQKITLLDGGMAEAELRHERKVEYIGGSAVRRMQNADIARCWTSWYDLCAALRSVRGAFRRMRNFAIGKSFNTWLDYLEEQAATKRLLSAAMQRIMRPALTAAYVHWHHDWQECVRGTEYDRLQAQIRDLQQTLESERHAAATRLELAEAETARLRQNLTSEMSSAERRQADARHALIERLYRGAVKRMLNGALSRGWETWQAAWEDESRQRRRLSMFVVRMLNRQLVGALAEWQRFLHELGIQRKRIGSYLARLANQHLLRGWNAWTSAWAARSREARMMSAFVGRLMNRDLARGWGAWCEFWEERCQQRRLLVVAAARLRHPELAGAFGEWRRDWKGELEVEHARILAEHARLFGAKAEETPAEDSTQLTPLELAEREADELKRGLMASEEAAALAREQAASERARAEQMEAELGMLREQTAEQQAALESLREQLASATSKLTRELEYVRGDYDRRGRELVAAREQNEQSRAAEAEAKAERDRALAQLALADEKLDAERRRLMQSMHSHTEQLLADRMEEVATNHEHRIRELTHLLALRDRQLMRIDVHADPRADAAASAGTLPSARPSSAALASSASSPRLSLGWGRTPSSTPSKGLGTSAASSMIPKGEVRVRAQGSGEKRSLDLRPIRRPATAAPRSVSASSRRAAASGMSATTSSAGLLVTASLPEAAGWAGMMARADAEPLSNTLPAVLARSPPLTPAAIMAVDVPASRHPSPPAWKSPFVRRFEGTI